MILQMPSFGITAIPNGGMFATTTIFRKSVIPNRRTSGITLLSNNPTFTNTGGIFMTENEKKLLQAKHRLEEAEMHDRNKERKVRTRRLIQEGEILEKVFPSVASMSLDDVEDFLCRLRR